MKFRKVIYLAVLLLISSGLVFGQGAVSDKRLFTQANTYYENGEYDKAIAEYDKIIASGRVSANLYYNLAGAYFKSGELGEAILNYRRALSLEPRDADINANYRFARAMVQGKIPEEKGFWSWRGFKLYSRNFTVNEMTLLTAFAYIIILIVLALGIVLPQFKRNSLYIALILIFFAVYSAMVTWHKAKVEDLYAVTVVPKTEALFGPFSTATKFFTLHEGMGVMVVDSKAGWYKVKRADGKIGWVRKDDVKKLHIG